MSFRYLGNKTRLADWIVGKIARVLPEGSSVADPMCGTASVSLALARAGYSVTAGDALTFPVIHARVRLLAKRAPAFKALGGYSRAMEWMRSVQPVEGYVFHEFGEAGRPANGRPPRRYFSAQNAARIDGIRGGIRKLARAGVLDEVEHSVLLHHLILAANKVANISGTYGYFLRSLATAARKPLTFEPIEFVWTPGAHAVLQGPIEQHARGLRTDAVYLDPPYTKRQYAGNYHVLETLARGDEPVAAGDGGLRPWTEQASDFCYRRTAGHAFRDLNVLAEHWGLAGAQIPVPTDQNLDTLGPFVTGYHLLDRLNVAIATDLGPEFELGHGLLTPLLATKRAADGTDRPVEAGDAWRGLAETWDDVLFPQLEDRYSGRPEQLMDLLRVDSAPPGANYAWKLRTALGGATAARTLAPVRVSELDVETIKRSFRWLVR